MLIYGIPEFRLPKDIVQAEVDRLVDDGRRRSSSTRSSAAPTRSPSCARRYDAVFLAVGAGLPVFMDVPGENLKGVYSANEYLTRVNLMGAWNADSATPVLHGQRVVGRRRRQRRDGRGAHRAPPRRRRGDDRLPALRGRAAGAQGGGPPRERRRRRVQVPAPPRRRSSATRTGWVTGLRCVEMELGEPDASGRRRPVAGRGSELRRSTATSSSSRSARGPTRCSTGSAPELDRQRVRLPRWPTSTA